MGRNTTDQLQERFEDLPPIRIPPYVPASPEEIARRRALAEQADRFREQVGPIGISVDDVIRELRDEASLDDDPVV